MIIKRRVDEKGYKLSKVKGVAKILATPKEGKQ